MRQLATVLALESVRLVLPNIRLLTFEELAEFRAESKELVAPFRRAMVRLSKELHAAIESDAKLADVQREARFLVETTIAPELEEMKEELARPTRPWYRRIVDVAMAAPEIVEAFSTMPIGLAAATRLQKR